MKKTSNKKLIIGLLSIVIIAIMIISLSIGIINFIHSFTIIYGAIISFIIEVVGLVISIKFSKKQRIFDILALAVLIMGGSFSLVDSMFIVKVPRVTEKTYKQAIYEISDCGLNHESDNEDDTDELLVINQKPEANTYVFKNTTIVLETEYIDSYSDGITEVDLLLREAKTQFELGNYSEAYRIYSDKLLSDNETAQINLLHIAAHGWGGAYDLQTIYKKLFSYNSDYAKLHQLAFLISYTYFNDDDEKTSYSSSINRLMDELYEQKNMTYINYIAHVKYDTEYDQLSDTQKKSLKDVSIEDCYELALSQAKQYENPPTNTIFSYYICVGYDYGNDTNRSLPYYYYKEEKVENLEYLDIIE